MKEQELVWFPCFPSKLLGALAGMKSPKQLVYLIVLLRIYESGGVCRDTLDAISTRTRLNKRVVSDALAELFREERLVRQGDGIANPKATDVIAESRELLKKRQAAGAEGGRRTARKRKGNQSEQPSKAAAPPEQSSTHLHKQDSLFSDENRAPEPSVAMANPPLDAEADLYRRGKEVLGTSAGGMIRSLLIAKGGSVAHARAAIEQASTRGDARQYVGAMIRGVNGAPARGNGFAAIRQRRAQQEGDNRL